MVIDKYGDRDGDGFQEYQTRVEGSGDAVMYSDGSLVKGPKALCELQGYVYNAWVRMAEALLGFQPDAFRNKRYVDPSLPARLPDLTVRDLRIGKRKLGIRFWTEGEQTAFEVIKGDPGVVERCDIGTRPRS
jgi:glycogen debranching enzyme